MALAAGFQKEAHNGVGGEGLLDEADTGTPIQKDAKGPWRVPELISSPVARGPAWSPDADALPGQFGHTSCSGA